MDPPERLDVVGPLDVPRVDPEGLERVMAGLRRSGETLRTMPVPDIAETLGRTGEGMLDELDVLGPQVAAEASLSEAMARRVVVGMADGWTRLAVRPAPAPPAAYQDIPNNGRPACRYCPRRNGWRLPR